MRERSEAAAEGLHLSGSRADRVSMTRARTMRCPSWRECAHDATKHIDKMGNGNKSNATGSNNNDARVVIGLALDSVFVVGFHLVTQNVRKTNKMWFRQICTSIVQNN